MCDKRNRNQGKQLQKQLIKILSSFVLFFNRLVCKPYCKQHNNCHVKYGLFNIHYL
jgi:hypothetical protein